MVFSSRQETWLLLCSILPPILARQLDVSFQCNPQVNVQASTGVVRRSAFSNLSERHLGFFCSLQECFRVCSTGRASVKIAVILLHFSILFLLVQMQFLCVNVISISSSISIFIASTAEPSVYVYSIFLSIGYMYLMVRDSDLHS